MPFSMSGNDAWSYNRFDAYEAALKGEAKEEETKTEEKEEVQEGNCSSKGYQEGGEVKCDQETCKHCGGKGCEKCKKEEEKEEEVKEGYAKGYQKGGEVKKAAKPDFLDMDKDGNKEEPMKKALADKKIKSLKKEELELLSMFSEEELKALSEKLSIDDMMRISQEHNRKSPEEKKAANKAVMGNVKKVAPKKDTRTDDEKMTDATGPRPGSNYRGD